MIAPRSHAIWSAVSLLAVWSLSAATLRAADPPAAPAAKPAATVSYFRDIRPIFQVHCQGCHQPAKAMGEFVMTARDGLLKGGESGQAAIVPGKPDESYLLSQITPDGGKAEMPKDKEPLVEDQLKKIRQWIAEGAEDDTPMSVRAVIDMEHPPVYEAPPVLTALDFSPDDTLLAVSGYHETLLFAMNPQGPVGDGPVARLVGQSERDRVGSPFRPMASRWLSRAARRAAWAKCRFGTSRPASSATRCRVTYDTVYGVSWSADGSKIAFGCADNTLRAIDAASGKQVLYQGAHSDWVLDTVFSKEGTYVISVSRDRSMKLVEVATQRFVDNITSITPGALKGGLAAVDRHPAKDELLIGGADGVPKIYQMLRTKARVIGDDFNLIKAYEAVPGRIYDVQFNHDGSRFVGRQQPGRHGRGADL